MQTRKLWTIVCIAAAIIYYKESLPQFLQTLWEGLRDELLEQLLALPYWEEVPADYRAVGQAILLAVLGPGDEYLELIELLYDREFGLQQK